MNVFFVLLVIISIFTCFVLTVFFLVTPRGSAGGNRALAALLFLFGLHILYSYMTSNYGYIYFMDWHKPIFIMRQVSLLTGPLVWLYFRSFTGHQEILVRKNLLHGIPFAVTVALLLLWYPTQHEFVIWHSWVAMPDTILILTSNFVYILYSARILVKAKLSFRSFFKSLGNAPHISWLQILLLGYMLVWIMNLNSFTIYMIARKPAWCSYTASIYALTVFLFVNLLMFLLLMKPDMYCILTKYKNSRLEDNDKDECLRKLTAYMAEKRPWLNPDITLEQLAAETGMNPRVLSQVINSSFGKSFKNYILDYRIKESMNILADHKSRNLTILEVLYQVGFNSKSAFNYQFKQYTSLTPQEYRAKCIRA